MSDEPIEPASSAEISNVIGEALQGADIHPAFAFAFRQCGFIVTAENHEMFDDEDLAEWESAIDRWCEMHPDETPP